MSQCVPNWDLDDGLPQHPQVHPSTTTTPTADDPAGLHGSDYVVSELKWKKGGLRGAPLRARKVVAKHGPSAAAATSWEKPPRASGMLEAVVDQATAFHGPSAPHHLVPWLGDGAPRLPAPAAAAAVDALVPSSRLRPHGGGEHPPSRVVPDCGAGGLTARPGGGDGNRSATASAASVGLTASASPETDQNTSCGRPPTISEGDDSSYSRRWQKDVSDEEKKSKKSKSEKGRSSVSTKRVRAAAVHNQSERKRRDRINQRMRTLQRLMPNSSKTDKASILDEVIDYMKQLQAQVQMMSRMSPIPHMMMAPMAMQQMQMAMMAQMAQMAQMGMAMGMGMVDVGQSSMPLPGFLPPSMPGLDVPAGRDQLQPPGAGAFPPDPFAAFMACQMQQPTTPDAYSRMAAFYQQLNQQPPSGRNHGT